MNHLDRDWIYSFLTALGIHGIVFLGFGLALTQSAEFGMELGKNSVEVNLVAAPPEVQPQTEIPKHVVQSIEPEPSKEDMKLPDPVKEERPQELKPVEEPKVLAKIELQVHGDGSSDLPGKDPTTLQSESGTKTELKPSYLKNPPPPYPENARRLGQEGLVLLTVEVNTEGRPASVKVKESSGFQILDEAALRAVYKWQFYPARIGSLPIASQVEIPIRFQLKDFR